MIRNNDFLFCIILDPNQREHGFIYEILVTHFLKKLIAVLSPRGYTYTAYMWDKYMYINVISYRECVDSKVYKTTKSSITIFS